MGSRLPDDRNPHGSERRSEVLGYWRKTSVSRQLEFLRRHHAGRFLLLVGDQYRADDEDAVDFGDGVVKYKKTPSVSEVLRAAAVLRPA